MNQHTHPPSKTNCKVAKVRAGIKRRATETVIRKQQILAEELGGISEGPAINLPAVENLHRNIRSVHQESNLPPLPTNTATIPALPIEFQTRTSGEQFLFFDSGAGAADRIIAFASVQTKTAACSFGKWVQRWYF